MCFLDDDDLYAIVNDPELFALFNLLEREQQIIRLRILKGFKFKIIAGLDGVSDQMIHRVYKRALKKMRKRLLSILVEYEKMSRPGK